MKIINDLHQLIRDNYDKIAEMPKETGNMQIISQPILYRENELKWFTIYYKGLEHRVTVFLNFPKSDEFVSDFPFTEQLWTDFYNELKEVLND